MLDIRQCGAERFQPLKLPSNTSSNCVMLKSQCNGEGQVDFSNGTTTHDRSCRCNYLNNFVFVTKPKATCYCVPSQEDCSCYYKACPVDHYLTPDYQCVHFSNLAGIFQCPEIQNEKKPKSVAPTKTIFTPKSIQDLHHWRLRAVITIFLMIFALLSLQGILIFHKKYRKLQEIANEKIMLKSEMLSTKHDTYTENSEISKGSTSLKKEELAESGKELIQSTLQNSISETENNLENMKKHLSLAKDVFSKSGKHKTVSTLVETRPLKLLKKHIVEKDYFCVIGVSGSGKSVILYQIADEMYNKEGYQIVTANKPSEVLEKNNDYRKQLFVFDDVCGKFTFDPTLADSWNLLSARIRELLKENKTKLIFSCRSNISKEQMYQAVSILAENTCDMQSSEFSMTSEDNNQIAKYFLTENDVDRLKTTDDFKTNKSIPLLCNLYSIFRNEETDVVHFFSNAKKILKDKIDFIANNPTCSTMFFFFVISNNNLSEKFVQDNKWIIAEIGESNISVEEIINAIQHNLLFVKKKYANFFVCHDMVFDVLVSSVSQRRLNEILKFACADLLCERSHFESIGLGPDYGCIKIPFDKEGLYFERLYSGFKTYLSFQNRQLKFKSYRKKFILIVLENLYLPKLILANDISPFLISTFQGFSDVVYALLKISGTSIVNITDKVGRTALYIAAEFNDIHTGTVLLNGKCDLNISRKDKYHEGETPLHIAAFKSNLRFVQLLIENHVDIDQLNVMQMTALHISSTKDDKNLVKYLLDNGANPNIPNTKMNTPLHTAVAKGNTVIVEFLINHESDLKKPNQDGESPLYLAVSKGHVVVVDMLLKASRSIVNVNYEYMYPLYFAAREGFYEIVKLLLDSGADPDSCALLEKSPLYVALEMGHFEIAKYLLQKKANANLYMYGGFTPIYVSSLKGYTKIVELLLRNNADPNICTSEKLSPLYVACIKGHSEIVEILLNKHANISLSDINNRSPLYVASREGHLYIVKLLLDHKADPNQATVVNRTPLFIATLEGQTDIVRHLLLKNANVNIATADRETPLLVASREGHTDIVKLLIDNGADINQATVANRSIFVAASKGHTNIVHYLLNKNANVNIATVDRETPLLFCLS
ncbi:uncharacterized protein LOC127716727 [Mytilus californianus]|uniref:uncharacterized protein LOC127716727 n=1 Tax=Mytilus californianus TaxID=6549 RepID=UPI0022451A9D|nr:uncharacterized protein LOC127716727 [Mytilus californianus]